MQHTADFAYYTETHIYYPVECGIIVFDSSARTDNGLYSAAEKAARKYIENMRLHVTGFEVRNVR